MEKHTDKSKEKLINQKKLNAKQTAIVTKSTDKKTDQDFPGFPDLPSSGEIIKPETKEEKLTANLYEKDGEKRTPAKARSGK